ncbi:MAG: squalene--hopene cyclase [Pandoraea sp.]|nr:squalene--hopene cyclase [Pandoraea sp.]
MTPPIIVVTGMPFEARIARGDGVVVVCAQNNTLASDLQAAMARDGARGLVSFGTAGGLRPGVAPGRWVIAPRVLDMPQQAHAYVSCVRWADALRRAMPDALHADLAGVTAPVVRADDKAAVWRESGAAAADMESHIVARVAQAHGLPFVAARVVIDPAERSLAVNPLQLPSLLSVGKDASRAKQAMRHGREVIALTLGDGFGAVAAGI